MPCVHGGLANLSDLKNLSGPIRVLYGLCGSTGDSLLRCSFIFGLFGLGFWVFQDLGSQPHGMVSSTFRTI